jgi:hypothetical protein
MADAIIQLRSDTAANWTAANPVLLEGELGHEQVTNKAKFGDGVTAWNALPYLSAATVITDPELTALAALVSAANKLPYYTGSGTAALADLTAFARTFLDDADAAAVRATLGLVLGTDVQAHDADLDAIAALATSAFGRSVLTQADAAALRTLAGLGTAAVLASDTDTTLANNSDLRLATQKAVKAYVDASVAGLLDFKGSQAAAANPNYPAASKGDAYYISTAGKVGGASGKSVDIGDVIVASADNAGGTEAAVGASWFVLEHNLTGALVAANNLSDLASSATARTNLGLEIGTNVQAFDADLAAIAALSTTAFGRGFLALADAAAARTLIGLVVGTDVQAYDADLASIAALTTTAFGRGFLTLADAAAARTLIGTVIGTDVQAYDADLASIAALTTTAYGRGQLTLADAAADTAQLNLATALLKGLVPASGGGTTNFLRADMTWAPPPGGGGGSGSITASGYTQNTATILYRKTGGSGAIEEQSLATLKTDLGLTGTNSGDQNAAGVAFTPAGTIAANTVQAAIEEVATDAAAAYAPKSPQIQAVASSATVTPTFSNDQVNITAQAAALNLANPTGTAVDGWGIAIRIKDNGTARAITYGTQYRAIGLTLPTTTVANKTLYLGIVYNAADTKWDVVALAKEA